MNGGTIGPDSSGKELILEGFKKLGKELEENIKTSPKIQVLEAKCESVKTAVMITVAEAPGKLHVRASRTLGDLKNVGKRVIESTLKFLGPGTSASTRLGNAHARHKMIQDKKLDTLGLDSPERNANVAYSYLKDANKGLRKAEAAFQKAEHKHNLAVVERKAAEGIYREAEKLWNAADTDGRVTSEEKKRLEEKKDDAKRKYENAESEEKKTAKEKDVKEKVVTSRKSDVAKKKIDFDKKIELYETALEEYGEKKQIDIRLTKEKIQDFMKKIHLPERKSKSNWSRPGVVSNLAASSKSFASSVKTKVANLFKKEKVEMPLSPPKVTFDDYKHMGPPPLPPVQSSGQLPPLPGGPPPPLPNFRQPGPPPPTSIPPPIPTSALPPLPPSELDFSEFEQVSTERSQIRSAPASAKQPERRPNLNPLRGRAKSF